MAINDDFKKRIINKTLATFTPEERGALEAMATMRVEHGMMKKQLVELKSAYDSLYATMITLLGMMPDKEITFHRSQFLRFKSEYRIDQKTTGDEIVLKLLTLTDKIG
jgi:hypothetical protein